MANPAEEALDYLTSLFEDHPEEFPNDKLLHQVATEKNWREVLKRLIVIRGSETPEQRCDHSRQGAAHLAPSCLAEEILRQVREVYLAASVEQELLDKL